MKFTFEVADSEAQGFCEDVVRELSSLAGVPVSEALQWVNHHWHGLRIGGAEEVLYHDNPEVWAERIARQRRQ